MTIRRLPRINVETRYTPFKGGLDVVTPMLQMPPGRCRSSQNVYQDINEGYSTFQGYERYDGQPAPSDAQYAILTCTITGSVSLGDILSDNTGAAYGTVIALPVGQAVLTKITGTFAAGNIKVGIVTVGTCTGAQVVDGADTVKLHAQYSNLAADVYRDSVNIMAGSGPILGVWQYNGTWYGFRNNSGGTATVMFESTSSGWSSIPLGRELKFTSGGTYETQEGDEIEGETSGATATVTRVVHESGIWLGIYKLDFTSGGDYEVKTGDIVEGATSGAVGTVVGVTVDSGGWAATLGLDFTSGGWFDIRVGDIVRGETSGAYAEVTAIEVTSGNWTPEKTLDFTSGGTLVIAPGDVITGAISGASATLVDVSVTSGSFAGGNAAGTFSFTTQDGVFQAENLDIGATTNVATISSDSTDTGSDAAGNLTFASQTGIFQSETLRVGTALNVATIAGDSTNTGSDAEGSLYFYSQTGTFEAENLNVPAESETNVATVASDSEVETNQNAAGRLIFSSQTGTFQAEELKVSSYNKVATIAGDSSAITFAIPSGRFEFVNTNFTGSADTIRMYGVDGKNRGFEFDGTVFVPIETGMTVDTPEHIYFHKNHLFFSYFGSAQHSAPGLPYQWSIVYGGNELGLGDNITGFLSMPGSESSATLAIFTRNSIGMLYGTGLDDWNLVHYKKEAGAIEWSMQLIGSTFMLDDRGVVRLATSQAFGNFADATVSQIIQPWLKTKKTQLNASTVVRDLNQYWLFFNDSTALCCTIVKGKITAFMPMKFNHKVTCVYSAENPDGSESIMFGSDDGVVYQMYKGTSFDGDEIAWNFELSLDHYKSPMVYKNFRQTMLELVGDGYAEFFFSYDLEYGSSDVQQPGFTQDEIEFSGARWDHFYWDVGRWDGALIAPAYFPMTGEATNMGLKLQGAGDYFGSIRFSGALVQFNFTRKRL